MEQEYRISTGMRIFYGTLAICMFIFAIFLIQMYHSPVSPLILLFPFSIIAGAALIVANLLKRKIIVSGQSVVCVKLFSTKTLDLQAIKGCRIGQKIIHIEPLSPADRTLTIGNYTDLGNNAALVQWLKDHLQDLDSLDRENDRKETLQDESLGFTPEERAAHLKKARQLAAIFNIAGVVTGLGLFFDQNPGIVFMMAYPFLGILLMARSKGLVKFVTNPKRSVHASILLGFLLSSFVLMIKSLGYHLFLSDRLWLPLSLIGAAMFLLFYTTGNNKSPTAVKGQIFVMLLVALLYGFGTTRLVNCVFDYSKPEAYKAEVLAHRVVHGRSTSYYLTLGPWGPREERKEVNIRKSLYMRVATGDSVEVDFKHGLLHIPWFTVTKNE